jgi:hypothetical protein
MGVHRPGYPGGRLRRPERTVRARFEMRLMLMSPAARHHTALLCRLSGQSRVQFSILQRRLQIQAAGCSEIGQEIQPPLSRKLMDVVQASIGSEIGVYDPVDDGVRRVDRCRRGGQLHLRQQGVQHDQIADGRGRPVAQG